MFPKICEMDISNDMYRDTYIAILFFSFVFIFSFSIIFTLSQETGIEIDSHLDTDIELEPAKSFHERQI